jgi:hypothetical protein
MAVCSPDQTECAIPEQTMLSLPFLAISGDVVLVESNMTTVSDVFRIFNDVVDTGGGTGLGTLVELYSADDGPLPSPATYSANVQFILENPNGITPFTGNGTTYVLAEPEPATFGLMATGLLSGLVALARRSKGLLYPIR